MNGGDNPFNPGYGTIPPYLAGRQAEQDALGEGLARLKAGRGAQGIAMYGPRGMGKTVLLHWLEARCQDEGVACVSTTPAARLRTFEHLPGLFLPASWRPSKVKLSPGQALGMGDALDMEWNIEDRAGNLVEHSIAACKRQPRALLLDEAHTLEDRALYQALLNMAQDVAARAPFLLVLAGTPGLMPHLHTVGATFIGRAKQLGIGTLAAGEAAKAVQVPLQRAGIAIQPEDLARIVADSQCYPFFLQQWGEALWHEVGGQPATITAQQVAAAQEVVRGQREGFYAERYETMAGNEDLLVAAHAVSLLFDEEPHPRKIPIKRRIAAGLTDAGLDDRARQARAKELADELERRDYFWQRPNGQVEAGIPSFMAYTCQAAAQDLGLE